MLRKNPVNKSIEHNGIYRRVFCTSRDYLGLGPLWAKPGDEIWIVNGCRMPLILRKAVNGRQYNLIAIAYLHGFMFNGAEMDEGLKRLVPVEIV